MSGNSNSYFWFMVCIQSLVTISILSMLITHFHKLRKEHLQNIQRRIRDPNNPLNNPRLNSFTSRLPSFAFDSLTICMVLTYSINAVLGTMNIYGIFPYSISCNLLTIVQLMYALFFFPLNFEFSHFRNLT